MDFSSLKVLVVGDICLDIVTNGECTRISPEAPVPVILNPIRNSSLGMAGNVALNLKNLGAQVDLFTYVGDDKYGDIVKGLLYEYDLCDGFKEYEMSNKSNTIVKERIMANGHQIARIDIEDITLNPEDTLMALKNGFGHNLYDLIIISDYNKGLIDQRSWNLMRPILNDLNKNNLYFVDTKKTNVLDFYRKMILFPNSKELRSILQYYKMGIPAKLAHELESLYIIETASKLGAYSHSDMSTLYSPAMQTEVFDVCGAGDTFIAAFSLYFSKHYNIKKALEFANYCCSKVVMKKGTIPIELSEVIDFDFKAELR